MLFFFKNYIKYQHFSLIILSVVMTEFILEVDEVLFTIFADNLDCESKFER